MSTAVSFFRPQQAQGLGRKARRLSYHSSQPAPPVIDLQDEEVIVEWWANLSPIEQRYVDAAVRQKLRTMVYSHWRVNGPLWAYARRFVVTHMIMQEIIVSEAASEVDFNQPNVDYDLDYSDYDQEFEEWKAGYFT